MCESQRVIISPCDGLPSLVDELNEGQSCVLLNGVLPLLSVEETSKLMWLGLCDGLYLSLYKSFYIGVV